MDRSDTITLIKQTKQPDAIGQYVAIAEEQNEVFCEVRSISGAEKADAGRDGHKLSYTFIMNRWEYDGETVIEYNGKRYGLYRPYIARDDTIELHCEEKDGLE